VLRVDQFAVESVVADKAMVPVLVMTALVR